MGRYHILFLTLCWSLILVALADADLEVKRTPDTGLDPKNPPTLNNTSNLNEKTGGLNSDIDSVKVDQAKNDKDQVGRSKEGGEDNKVDQRNPSEQKDVDLKGDEKKGEDGSVGKGKTKEGDQVEKKGEDGSVGKGETKEGDQVEKKGEDGSVEKGKTKEGDQVEKKGEDGSVEKGKTKEGDQVEKKGEDGSVGKRGNKEGDQVEKKDEDGSVEKGGNKEGSNEGGEGDKKDGSSEGSESKEAGKVVPEVLPQERKEGPHGEECDASNSCKAEKDALIACLRVPGNDSPDLSLLIQNKGNKPLSVAISAPNFVQLEKRNVQLRQKEDRKVKVSITEGGTDGKIVLTAGRSNCSLDLRDLPSLNPMKETDDSRKFSYISLVKKPHIIAFTVISTLMLITASAWTCVRFKRKHFDSNASKYQKLEMELPVSGGGKVMSEVNDDWDDNWDDNWDDEEAPMTPSMPLTPSVSSKGLASRRLSKEAWKD